MAVLGSAPVAFAADSSAMAAPPVMCKGHQATIVGTDGDDTITGTPQRDVIAGLAGHDVIRGGGGNDLICGGDGDDGLLGGPGNDAIYGASGDDLARGNGGADLLHGGLGNDHVQGGPGGDRMYGDSGISHLTPGSGDDVVHGNNTDVVHTTVTGALIHGNALMYGGASAAIHVDLAKGIARGRSIGHDKVHGVTVVYGSGHNDTIDGDRLSEELYGGNGADHIDGRGGDDYIDARAGGNRGANDAPQAGDYANGGNGTDTCRAATTVNCEKRWPPQSGTSPSFR